MENLVNKIIEINKVAESRVKAAENRREEQKKRLETEKQQLIEEINSESKQKLEKFEQSQKSESDASIAKIHEDLNKEKQRLKSIYDESREQWVKFLVDEVLHN